MITINLLPKSTRPDLRWQLVQTAIAAAAFGIAAIFVVVALLFSQMVRRQQSHLFDLDGQIAKAKDQLKIVQLLETNRGALKSMEAVVDELILRRVRWAPKLSQLCDMVPQDAWLEKIYIKPMVRQVELTIPQPSPPGTTGPPPPPLKKTIQVTDKYLYIDGVTAKLDSSLAVVGELINNLQNTQKTPGGFMYDFEGDVNHDVSKLEHWDPKDDKSPMVWRFTLFMKLKSPSLDSADQKRARTMAELTAEKKRLLAVAIGATVVALLVSILMPGFGLRWSLAQYGQNKTDLAAKEAELKSDQDKLQQTATLAQENAELQNKLEFYQRRLPGEPRTDELMEELQRLALVAGQNYVAMQTLPKVEKTNYVELPLKITLTSDYHGLGNYLNMVENSDRFSKVDDLLIIGDKDYTGRHHVELTLSTFTFVTPTPAAMPTGTPAAVAAK